MKVKKQYLILIAGCVWIIAGANVLNIGIQAYLHVWNVWMLLGAVVVFTLFHVFIFQKMVRKHTARILAYEEEKQNVFRFFDVKSYLIMAAMITFGIALRASGLLPGAVITTIYCGLSLSLILAGITFVAQYVHVVKQTRELHCPVPRKQQK